LHELPPDIYLTTWNAASLPKCIAGNSLRSMTPWPSPGGRSSDTD
jgi:hypothetical protein